MAMQLDISDIGTRESRLGSITGYVGDLKDLATQSNCGSLKGCSRCFSQSSTCLSGCALSQLAGIRDVAVVHHGPSGCSVTGTGIYAVTKQVAAKRGIINNSVYIGTDMNEEDTIFGAGDALKDIVLETYRRYKPKAIFVSSSCATGIIGEDIDSIVDDLREEIDVPIAAVHCEGFKSRIWATGFDISDHAVLSTIVQPPKQKRNTINFKNFFESARNEIIEIFKNFDVEPTFLYANATVEELSHISEALATVCICGTLGNYLGNGLEEKYGVPYIRTINPLGVVGFETWLREIGKVIHKEVEVEKYIEVERAKYLPKIEEVKKELVGLKAVLGMGPGYTFEVSRVLQELGIEVLHAAAWHYDKKYENGEVPPAMEYLLENNPNFEVSVADQQNFEVLNILNRLQPDVYLSRHPGSTVWAIKQGFPAVYVADEYMIFGYKGTLDFAHTVLDTIRNRSFEKNLAKRVKLPYTDWWYKQESGLFLDNK
ncbi:nitrogenase component 1 [[Clostridium] fimetarium]|uniref:Nitrogenase molybdenum-iron protein alpha chain n=1 Tax=[Clostridium] fimetarium TaxID=99656 RepID=A0A1I0PQD3_9FIRM|nr:nitrogenase component 1 [[Clostridium] fimetarium]SEW16048.1 nitrogenase molybdenum-iron protein alpha chain [[Clostridium] fimetarium]